jgi:hypothetical protein
VTVTPARQRLLLALGVLFFCTAPTPGDVGGCGQDPQELDPETFFETKDSIDCTRCNECSFTSRICDRACSSKLSQVAFPEDCLPLVHDGEVCLRALLDASCDDYSAYVRDEGPEVPTECNFCPAKEAD